MEFHKFKKIDPVNFLFTEDFLYNFFQDISIIDNPILDIFLNDNDFNNPIRNEQNDNTTKQSEGTNQPV